ncbi:MAG: 30S ribosomal protein S18 [Ignavibacteriales bacterium]|nr:30S ribosomal protein S18 [Ignavibacteriales bacterium]
MVIDYKNVEMMTRFINETGKIRPRRQTGTCAGHQREVASAIKNARHIALVPFDGDLWSENSH